MKKKKTQIHEKIVKNLELPQDLLLKAAIITITGRSEVLIENYRGNLNLEDSFIRIQAKNEQILIEGTHLAVAYYTNEEMKVTGTVDAVRYEYP